MGSDVNLVCIRELIKKGELYFLLSASCCDVSTDPSDEIALAGLQAEDDSPGLLLDSAPLLSLQEPGPSQRSLQPGPASMELEL